MNNEQEIERMEQLIDTATRAASKRFVDETAKWVKEHHHYDSRKDCNIAHSKSINREVAETLCNADIGDKKQAVIEAFERLQEIGKSRTPRCTCSGIEIDISQPFVITNKDLDELFTELYGAEE